MNERLQRQIACIGESKHYILTNSNIAIVGCGGVGSEVAPQLAKMGANLILIEPKLVSVSNAGRQSLYRSQDVGYPKVEVAADRLNRINPDILIETHNAELTDVNAKMLLASATVIVDCTDKIGARRVIDCAARALGKSWVHTGVVEWSGNVGVFLPGGTPMEHFIRPFQRDGAQDPHEMGTMTPAVGMVASIAVAQVYRCVVGEATEQWIRVRAYIPDIVAVPMLEKIVPA